MDIRPLCEKDAPYMLEWMHDADLTKDLKKDFASTTLEDAKKFISYASQSLPSDLHMAIVNDEDEYMGTVSLKHIHEGAAEFGIAVRRCATGKGFSAFGMKKILEYGVDELGLNNIFWCVDPVNARAVRFYDKNGYERVPADSLNLEGLGYEEDEISRYVWYSYRR